MNYKNKLKHLNQLLLRSSFNEKINFLKFYSDYYLEPDKIHFIPLFLQIEPTTYCNLKCESCSNPHLENPYHLKIKELKIILSQFEFVRKINLVGLGEPLMNPDLIAMIAEIKGKGIEVGFATNGVRLTERIAQDLIEKNLDWLNISVDSANAEKFSQLRGNADLNFIINNIKNLIKIKKSRKSELKVGIASVISFQNIEELKSLIDLSISLEVDSIQVQSVHLWGNSALDHKLHHWSQFSTKEIQLLKEAKAYAKKKGLYFVLNNTPDKNTKRACKWPWKSCYITANGFVTPCCMQACDPKVINFGNLLQEPFAKIKNNIDYINFRKELKSPVPPSVCKGCPAYFKTIQL